MRVPLNELLYALSRGLDFVEQEVLGVTQNHGLRTAYISGRICRAMGMSDIEVLDMACCAILHDNALTEYMMGSSPEHFGCMQQFIGHCANGEKNVKAFPFADDALDVVMYHHENWNGSGFHQLSGNEIPVRAAILRLADNMDLCLSLGDNRASLADEMRDHALKHSGRFYSPEVVRTLVGILDSERNFSRSLADPNILLSLRRDIPTARADLGTAEMIKICNRLASIIDAKSSFTRDHSSRVARQAYKLAPHFDIGGERAGWLVIAAYLHDIGKLSTPMHILDKPSRLNNNELAVMHKHVEITGDLLHGVPGLGDIVDWSANHHEKLNGQGYPNGYGENELSMEGHIITCCDIYQALIEERPYRQAMGHGDAMRTIHEMAYAGELDPRIIEVLKHETTN
ncbi:MAG: HD domain-containing protein [Deltaproteobacteria bacterium]|jgi:HD-GYP domain-containing protein (c-di-GMP phosphodiesterase class II)|nr:HD domain-containing protein [Deltaproteobacteria bacterium]